MNPVMDFGDKVYHLMVRRVMCGFRGDDNLAHESAAEIWLAAALKGPGAFAGESDLVGWCLYRCVFKAIDLKRKWRAVSGRWEVIDAIAADENEDLRHQIRHELALAVAKLPVLDRHIIALYFEESLSDREIAALLLPESYGAEAGRKKIQRRRLAALRELREGLKSCLDYDEAVAAFAA